MTISSSNSKSGPYVGNGVTTVFARTFRVLDADHLKVYKTIGGVTSEVVSGITKDGIGSDTGNVTFSVAPASGDLVTLAREIPLTQDTDYSAQGKVSPEQVEDDLDLQEMKLQDISEKVERSYTAPITGKTYTNGNVPSFDAQGNLVDSGTSVVQISVDASAASASAISAEVSAGEAQAYQNSLNSGINHSINGLSITVDSLRVVTAAGGDVLVAGATLAAKASDVMYVVVDLGTMALKMLDRTYHDGCYPLLRVEAGAAAISNVKGIRSEPPKSRVSRTLSRLVQSRQAGDVRIAILGDSLAEAAGSGTRWPDMLFTLSGDSYQITGYDITDVTNHAIGSSTAHMGACLLANSTMSNTGAFNSTVTNYGPQEAARSFDPPSSSARKSSIIMNPPDLAIVCFGVNGGDRRWGLLENIVWKLRRAGSEVIILTENQRTDSPTAFESNVVKIRAIADATGSALADTYAYVREAVRLNGGSTTGIFADVVHMAQDGHDAYAEAIRGVLSPGVDLVGESMGDVSMVAKNQQSADDRNWHLDMLSDIDIQFDPAATTGTVDQAVNASVPDNKNIAVIVGGKTQATSCTTLTTGQTARFAHMNCGLYDIAVGGDSAFTARVTRQSGGSTDIALVEHTASDAANFSNKIVLKDGVTHLNLAPSDLSGQGNIAPTIEVLSGTMKLVGMVFYTDTLLDEIDFETLRKRGTWATETGIYLRPETAYTDTDGDSFTFDFEGSYALVQLNSRSAAGIIDVYRNGEKIGDQIDLYSGGSFLKSMKISAADVGEDRVPSVPVKCTVTIKLNGVNGSAGSPSSANRRLQINAVRSYLKP